MIHLYKGNNKDIIKKVIAVPNIVYLDPPYGTKNKDLIYKDGVVKDEWLDSFILRLKEIKKIISNDSVIYVSIGHEEVGNAKNAMDIVFGRNNFVALMPRLTINTAKTTNTISRINDFLIVYKIGYVTFKGLELNTKSYKLKDAFFDERGYYQIRRLDYNSFRYQKTMDSPIEFKKNIYYPGNKSLFKKRSKGNTLHYDWCWIWSIKKINFAIKNGYIEVKKGFLWKKTYTKSSIKKIKGNYEIINRKRDKPITSLFYINNSFANNFPKSKMEKMFSYPKSDYLIEDLLKRPNLKNKVILDPYAGSGTTGLVADKLGYEAHLIQMSEKVRKNSNIYKEYGINDLFELTKKTLKNKTEVKIYE